MCFPRSKSSSPHSIAEQACTHTDTQTHTVRPTLMDVLNGAIGDSGGNTAPGTSAAAAMNLPQCREYFGVTLREGQILLDPARMALLPTPRLGAGLRTILRKKEAKWANLHAPDACTEARGCQPRVSTWEDWVFDLHQNVSTLVLPLSEPSSQPRDSFIQPLAVGSTRRPVKVMVRLGDSTDGARSFLSPPIWKSASTTLGSLLSARGALGPHGCHVKVDCDQRKCGWAANTTWSSWNGPRTASAESSLFCAHSDAIGFCDKMVNTAGVCLQHGSFALPNAGPHARTNVFRFAFVRDPLDRFLSTFRPVRNEKVHFTQAKSAAPPQSDNRRWHFRGFDPHGTWARCTPTKCAEEIRGLRDVAKHLESDLTIWASGLAGKSEVDELQYGLLHHALTQMYFLSGTDSVGHSMRLDFLGRLENFASDWATVEQLISKGSRDERTVIREGTDALFNARKNPGSLDQTMRDAIERDRDIVCPVCRIYAQDYECLGYSKPLICVKDGGAACRSAKYSS